MAELALQCKFTLPQAIDHSMAQLQLLAEAANRLAARDALVTLDALTNAMGAFWGKGGDSNLKTTRSRLLKQASE